LKSRLFVSLDIPDQVVNKIIDYRDSIGFNPDMRWESKEKHHLTLKFIGNTVPDEVPQIQAALNSACSGIQPFDLKIGRTGVFGSFYDPKVIWFGIEENETLQMLAR